MVLLPLFQVPPCWYFVSVALVFNGIAVSFTASTKMYFSNLWFLINKTPADAERDEDPVAVLLGHRAEGNKSRGAHICKQVGYVQVRSLL